VPLYFSQYGETTSFEKMFAFPLHHPSGKVGNGKKRSVLATASD